MKIAPSVDATSSFPVRLSCVRLTRSVARIVMSPLFAKRPAVRSITKRPTFIFVVVSSSGFLQYVILNLSDRSTHQHAAINCVEGDVAAV